MKRKALPKAKPQLALEKRRAEQIAEVEDALCALAGVRTKEVAYQLATQIVNLQFWSKPTTNFDSLVMATSLLGEIKPETAIEGMLAVQLVGVHQAATMFLARANMEGQTVEGTDVNVLRATRLMRLFNEQLEAMAKLKGKAGQQKVTVEHVHVHGGGQAIVGAVSAEKSRASRGRGG